MVQKHSLIERALVVVLCVTTALTLLLWRLGLPPLYAGLIAINVVTFLLYGYDKRRAIASGVRVPEVVLHIIALLGGSPGALLGQGLFRHKTRKRAFQLAFAGIVLAQGVLIYGYWRYLRGGS